MLFCLSWPLLAQDGDGGTEDNMSILGFGARPLGMGKAFTALADDPTAVYWNPAALEDIRQQGATFFHSSLWGGASYDFLGYAYPTINIGTFGLGIARIGVDGIQQTDASEDLLGNTFSNAEYQVFASYAKRLPWDLNLTPGITLRMFQRSWTGLITDGDLNDTGFGVDAGFMYRPEWLGSPWMQDWAFGMKIQNLIAPSIKEGNVSEDFPVTVKLGMLKKVRFAGGEFVSVLLDLDFSEKRSARMHFGGEYRVRDYGELRMGYTTGGFTFGASVEYESFRIDYSYGSSAYSDVMPGIHRISFSYNFGNTREELYVLAEQARREEQAILLAQLREEENRQFIVDHLKIGENYFNERRYLDAIVEYQQILNLDSSQTRALVMLDSANVLYGKSFEAAQALALQDALDKSKAELTRQFVDERFEKARILLDRNQFDKALIEFNLALERDPGNPMILNAVTTTNRRISEEARRLIQLSRTESANQNFSEAQVHLSGARSLAGSDSSLIREINAASRQVDIQLNMQKGLLLFQIEEYNRALVIFEDLLKRDPKNEMLQDYVRRAKIEVSNKDVTMDQVTEKRYVEGMAFFLNGKYSQAIEIWEEILLQQPYNKRVLQAIQGAKEKMAQSTK
jgi:tetratricopeptide (TPR) repeat protein